MISFDYSLRELLKEEGLNLKEFCDITEVSYPTFKLYYQGKREPKLSTIQKILLVPQFSKYSSLLLGLEEPIQKEFEPGNSRHDRFQHLMKQVREKGLETEALGILQALAAQQEEKLLDPDN